MKKNKKKIKKKSKIVPEQIINKETEKVIKKIMVKELTQSILPFSLHGINPRTIMGDQEWNKIKKQKQKEADHHCMICGCYVPHTPNDWLECHETYDIDKNKKEFKLKDVICICHKCHSFIHSGRLEILYQENKITLDEYNEIIEKGKNY